ncbi:MAG: penicillin-binding transpeptidase domain-containing protein, partial [Lactobacillaceae bacterium]
IQLLQAYTAIANQGQIIKPQIVKKIVNPTTKNIEFFKIIKKGRPISVNAANETLNEMRRVVNEKYGTGVVYAVPNLDLAVKTGTAEISTSNGSGYLGGSYDYLYSVMGIYPANNPRYIFYVSMKKPQVINKQPEQMLSEIFKPMITYSMSYSKNYQSLQNSDVTVPNLANFSRNEAQDKLLKKGLKPIIIGSGTNIVQQLPYPQTKVLNGDKIILLTNGAMVLPDLKGWSKSDVIKLGQITGKNISINGNGYVSKQSLPPGSSIDFTKKISVDLKENTNEN